MEKLIRETDHIEQIICEDHSLLQVVNYFGFQFGFENLSIKEACIKQKIDLPLFLSVINFIHLRQQKPNIAPYLQTTKTLYTLNSYLQCSLNSLLQHRLPYVRRKMIEAIDYSEKDRSPYLFLKGYLSLSVLIKKHVIFERTEIQPYIDHLLRGLPPSQEQNLEILIPKQKTHHGKIREKITSLIQTIIKHYNNQAKYQLMNEALLQLFSLEEEFKCHSLIEEKLFLPCAQKIESINILQPFRIKQKHTQEQKKKHDADTKLGQLSEREKQVIYLVLQGLSNRQIAEKLQISVNTVLTHRRHINKKLEIHSTSELTLHALLNGLISIKDLK